MKTGFRGAHASSCTTLFGFAGAFPVFYEGRVRSSCNWSARLRFADDWLAAPPQPTRRACGRWRRDKFSHLITFPV